MTNEDTIRLLEILLENGIAKELALKIVREFISGIQSKEDTPRYGEKTPAFDQWYDAAKRKARQEIHSPEVLVYGCQTTLTGDVK